jgi:DHA1 family multidrug resistance protein-like MFS transporter
MFEEKEARREDETNVPASGPEPLVGSGSGGESSDEEEDPPKFFGFGADEEAQALSRKATTLPESYPEGDFITRILTAGSRKRMSLPLPTMGGGRDYPPSLGDRDPYKVDFDGPNDPIHPHNWPLKRKLPICASLGFTTLVAAWSSAIYATAVDEVMAEFHVGLVVAILGVSLYVMGFAAGPILWAPLSELFGRKMPIMVSFCGFTIFQFAVATAKDFQTLMLCRFFGGFFGAAPTVVVSAAFADIFNNEQRGKAMAIFTLMVFCGPTAAPVVGGFIVNSHLHWQWTEYITGIMGALALVLDYFIFKESYHPVILTQKASDLRRRTGNWGIYAPHEVVELDMAELISVNVARPLRMLFTEPILLLVTIYQAFIYGILYLLLEAYPIVFSGYGFKGGIVELPYLSLTIGMVIAGLSIVLYFEPYYVKKLVANGGKPVPEARLPPMILGGILFPTGIFWFTWSGNYPHHVHWMVPTVSGLFTGYGLLAIFLASINYIVDSYLFFAASALAGNTFLRCSFGATFPLFATAMFDNLGINWAGTVLGCIGVVLAPVPVLFYLCGKKLRVKSKFAFDL